MYVVVWEYAVPAPQRAAFEAAYGSGGAWVQLFRRSPEYRGTTLYANVEAAGRYLTLDHWTSADAYDAFRAAHAVEYAAIDAQCDALTDSETRVGVVAGE